jgi:hypothetical protein
MHPETSDLLTRWITGDGAEDIMVAAGIIRHKIYIPDFCVSRSDRETYLRGVLFTVAGAVAQRSANPAALVEGSEEEAYWSYGEREIQKWAKRSARSLEQLLDEL